MDDGSQDHLGDLHWSFKLLLLCDDCDVYDRYRISLSEYERYRKSRGVCNDNTSKYKLLKL